MYPLLNYVHLDSPSLNAQSTDSYPDVRLTTVDAPVLVQTDSMPEGLSEAEASGTDEHDQSSQASAALSGDDHVGQHREGSQSDMMSSLSGQSSGHTSDDPDTHATVVEPGCVSSAALPTITERYTLEDLETHDVTNHAGMVRETDATSYTAGGEPGIGDGEKGTHDGDRGVDDGHTGTALHVGDGRELEADHASILCELGGPQTSSDFQAHTHAVDETVMAPNSAAMFDVTASPAGGDDIIVTSLAMMFTDEDEMLIGDESTVVGMGAATGDLQGIGYLNHADVGAVVEPTATSAAADANIGNAEESGLISDTADAEIVIAEESGLMSGTADVRVGNEEEPGIMSDTADAYVGTAEVSRLMSDTASACVGNAEESGLISDIADVGVDMAIFDEAAAELAVVDMMPPELIVATLSGASLPGPVDTGDQLASSYMASASIDDISTDDVIRTATDMPEQQATSAAHTLPVDDM